MIIFIFSFKFHFSYLLWLLLPSNVFQCFLVTDRHKPSLPLFPLLLCVNIMLSCIVPWPSGFCQSSLSSCPFLHWHRGPTQTRPDNLEEDHLAWLLPAFSWLISWLDVCVSQNQISCATVTNKPKIPVNVKQKTPTLSLVAYLPVVLHMHCCLVGGMESCLAHGPKLKDLFSQILWLVRQKKSVLQ